VTDVNAAEGIGLPVADDPRSHRESHSVDGTRQPPRNERLRSGRPAPAGNRIVPPVQGGRHAVGEAPERPTIPLARGESTVDLNSVTEPLVMPGDTPGAAGQHNPAGQQNSAGNTGHTPPVPPRSGPPTQAPGATVWPSRPAPDDAAAEVWALVERAQRGDAEAFGLIYDRYMDTVFRFIYFRVGSRPLAEDLTADTFLRALKRIGSFTWQGRDLGAWLVTIARNLVADHFKSGRYRLEVTTGDVLDADKAERGPEGSPEAAVVDHITNVALLRAVKQLNPEQQECIVLRVLHGFSVAETAQAMGKNEGAIKALQYRAVRALHRLLPEGFQP
jgi:RNA polymerase sigma-70 factor (ECF subfamily)